MMNGLPSHQQPPPPPPGGIPQPTGGYGGPPPTMNHNHIYGGQMQQPPMMQQQQQQQHKPNVVPLPGGGAPPPSMMTMNRPPTNQLPPSVGGGAFPSAAAPTVPTNSQPGMVSQQQLRPQMAPMNGPPNGVSANSSRTASPLPPPGNRIPTGQLPPQTPLSVNNHGLMAGTAQTPSRLDLNSNPPNLTANFTPLKASTPQYGSPVVGPPIMSQSSAGGPPGQMTNNVQALNQGIQNMNFNNHQQQGNFQQMNSTGGMAPMGMNGPTQQLLQQQPQMPPARSNPQLGAQLTSQGGFPTPPISNALPPSQSVPPQPSPMSSSQPPQPGMMMQQRPPVGPPLNGTSGAAGGGGLPPMSNRYPPMMPPGQPQQQQQQFQQQPSQSQPPPPGGQIPPRYPPTAAGGAGGFGPMGGGPQQSMQYQSQMPPQPQQQQQMNQYPQQQANQFQNQMNNNNIQRPGGTPSVTQSGFNRLWGMETVDLLQNRHILPPEPVQPPPVKLNNQFYESVNCSPDVFRCTVNKIPETKELLNKSRLPLGVLIHPFRDINKLPVIQCTEIVRCRACRTYINPFVYFVDSMKWKCNLCYRVNELPKEFQYDPITKTYGDVTRRPEVKSSTIEFIASSEYMLRPPPPAIYLFLLDVSSIAVQSGYLNVVCQKISDHLDDLPGDARTQVGFVAFNSAIHFYNIAENFNQPHEITVLDVDDVFLPCPDNLLVNLKECKELIKDLLVQLPKRFVDAHDSKSALGAALQAAFKLMGSTGGRVTVFQTCLPNDGPGALQMREDPNNRSSKDVPHLGPATDYYKRLALECSGQQISVDLFVLNSQYSDIATLSGISKYSGGCMHHFPLFSHTKAQQVDALKACLERYLTRKIGFEAVMRIRCTRGLAIHTFHGNFFVRSTDLLSLPNVNPDAGFAMQIAHEESLTDLKTVCFQAALLYTSSKGERRIRVHTLCLPVVNQLTDVLMSADSQAIAGLLVKMGVDRSLTSTLADAREAFINATVDILSAFKLAQNLPPGQVVAPMNLALLPLYINAIMKHIAFRTGMSTRLDDRSFAMCEMKTMPLGQLIRYVYPDFYNIDCLFVNCHQNGEGGEKTCEGDEKLDPPRLQLSAERLDSRSIFLMDTGPHIMIYVGTNANPQIVQKLFGVEHVGMIPDLCYTLQNNNSAESEALFAFIDYINEDKPFPSTIQIIRDSSSYRAQFTEKFVDDRTESALSYYEFLQHLRTQVK